MAGLDPAIQGHALEHLRMLRWMAASEGGHGVVDEADCLHEASFAVRHGREGGHPCRRLGMRGWIPAFAGMTIG
jgi:hypothetical protein